MRHLIQSFFTGDTKIIDIPIPKLKPCNVIIKTSCSLISSGTERMLVEFSKSNILQKIKQQPDKVSQVLHKLKSDGFFSTYEALNTKLDEPISLGYCNVGKIISVGKDVKNFKIGDRVVSNGCHSEIVSVPEMLCAKIPDVIEDEKAVFTILASVGLQGIRLCNPSFGETILVSGLGLIGLVTCQILKANGINVLGVDTDPYKCKIASDLNIKVLPLEEGTDQVSWCHQETNYIGIDGAIITASTTSNAPLDNAAKACRKRARVILVGKSGSEINRDLFYEKELSFQVSCSYGPGRYDKNYEEFSNDYPVGFVRWTEQRNFEAILKAMEDNKIFTETLISHRFKFEDSLKAYDLLLSKKSQLGIILKYKKYSDIKTDYFSLKENIKINNKSKNKIFLGVIGSGNYASRILIPNLISEKVVIDILVANEGLKPYYLAEKYPINNISTNKNKLFKSRNIDSVIIATRHDSHSELVIEALKNNKSIFVEKPLCINSSELDLIKNTYKKIYDSSNKEKSIPILMVGFNRRFSPLIIKIKDILDKESCSKSFVYTVNPGKLDKDHWLNDKNTGGGRFIGEACHFVDLILYLSNSKIKDLHVYFQKDGKNIDDVFSITILFEDGSLGNINYLSNGHKSFPKERLEIFYNEKIIQLDNFRKINSWGIKIKNKPILIGQDKGHKLCLKQFLLALKEGNNSPIPFDQIFEVHNFLFRALNK